MLIKTRGWFPQVGNIVIGLNGQKEVIGVVLPHPKEKNKPYTIEKFGTIGMYIQTTNGKKIFVTEIQPFS